MDNLQPGQMLGSYRIINQVGQGGMATVYKAYQPSMDRHVAIKVLPSQLAESKEFVKRFQQEARVIARLEHPHILPAFDYGESDGTAYFVMRYLEAGTLKDRMEAGRPLPLDEIDRIFTQLADALSYAHSHGVIHRDLKPSNALVDRDGNLFLTDFGIAKILESASPRLTQTDAIMGTPAYISPEQAQARTVDQRSDIYSLGIILYEMATGSVPFVADTPLAVILKHVSDPLPLPSRMKPDISPSIEQVILKALAKDPEDRFATAAEFLSAWKRALNEEHNRETAHRAPEVISSPTSRARMPAPATVTATKPARSTGWIVGCLIIACLVLAVGGGGIFLASNWSTFNPAASTPLPTLTNVPLPTETPIHVDFGNVLLEDDFSTEDWGTLTNSDTSIEYLNNALNMNVVTKNWFVWSTPDDIDYENVHMEVTVIVNASDSNTAFGVMCNQQATSDDSYYYFAITPSAQYAIAKADVNQTGSILTNNNEWGTSGSITQDASSYRIGADCGNGTLTLYVDGQRIASVSDASYTKGGIALFTWSAEEATATDISFDDFLMTKLP
ncbi:MAG: serine/threonine protein kinase [Anaerolineae bacterium]|nr:serine/threonine protein kinase [Anaerolineae bacterium]MCI0608675.1 serine/threonine protein kinase [Anaerolineae bacterium]